MMNNYPYPYMAIPQDILGREGPKTNLKLINAKILVQKNTPATQNLDVVAMTDADDPIQDLSQRFEINRLFRNPDEVEERLFEKIKSVRKSCGQVCDTTIRGRPGKVKLNKQVDHSWSEVCS